MQPSHLAIRPSDSREVTVLKDFAELHKVLENDSSARFLIAPEAMQAYLTGHHFAGVEAADDVMLVLDHGEYSDVALWGRSVMPNGLGLWNVVSVARKVLENASDSGVGLPFPLALFDAVITQRLKNEVVQQAQKVDPPLFRSAIPAEESDRSSWWNKHLLSLSSEQLVPGTTNTDEATAYKAGLLLSHDLLDESHALSQSIEGVGENGDYWHAIMHRREPDFGNAKYWFRRVGQHPVFTQLAEQTNRLAGEYEDKDVSDWTARLTNDGWDSFAIVDLAEEVHQPAVQGSPLHEFAERVQALEILLLLQHTMRAALRKED